MTSSTSSLSDTTRRSVLLLSFATFSSMATQRMCDAMLPELSRVFSVTLTEAAQVVSAFAVVYGVAQLVYGPMGDRLGKFRVLTFATLACSAGCIAAAFAPGLDMLIAARVLVALGAAAIIPLTLAWIGDAVPHDRVQATLARVGLGTTLGIAGGQLIGGLFTDTLGWRWAFGFMTLLFGGVGLLLLADLRRQPPMTVAAGTVPATARTGFLAQALTIITGPWSRIVLLVAFVEGAAGFGVLAIWASHLHAAVGLSLSAAGLVVAGFGLGGMVYMATAKVWIGRSAPSALAFAGVALVGVAAPVLGLVPVWWASVPASLVAGFGFFMFHNSMQTNATHMAPQARGTAVSLFAAFLFLGQSAGVHLAATLMGRFGSGLVIALGGAVLFVTGFFFSRALAARERSGA
jgi:predicted MFS family arabinose efflux permease